MARSRPNAERLTCAQFRDWLRRHHQTASGIFLAVRRAGVSGDLVTYAEALDHALCFGWIDGVRHSLDSEAFSIRFTPRKARSIWSQVNLRHYERLFAAGRIEPAGAAAFAARDPRRTGLYSFENRPRSLPPEWERAFQADTTAWAWFSARAPSYRRTAIFWVLSAKKPETRQRRFATLIADSAAGRRIKPLQ